MKKAFFFIITVFCASSLFAQDWISNGANISNPNTGNVGIGTTTPDQKLTVVGSVLINAENNGIIIDEGTTRRSGFIKYSGKYAGLWRAQTAELEIGRVNQTSLPGTPTAFYTDLFINAAGDVGIGTTDPKGYKLAVNGKGIFTELKVKLFNTWPDYVFNKTYNRLSLASLEEYIKENNHLPNIPSAQEIKNNGGIELGEMNTKLLEKIEELTLYVIELKKEIDALKTQKVQAATVNTGSK